jgi:hypothetical protein
MEFEFYTEVVGCGHLSTTPNEQMVFLDAAGTCLILMKKLLVFGLLALAGCGSSSSPPPPPAAATIPDMTVFLVQGTPEQKSSDPVTYRKVIRSMTACCSPMVASCKRFRTRLSVPPTLLPVTAGKSR